MKDITMTSGIFNDSPKKRINADKTCETHGEKYKEISFDNYNCVSCLKEKEEKDRLNHQIKDAFCKLNLPKKLDRYSFDNFKQSDKNKLVLQNCKKYVGSWPDVGGIIMLGGVGTGKTHLAVSICKNLCSRGVYCYLTTTNKIIRSVRSSWGTPKPTDDWGVVLTEELIIEKYVNHDLLVIDEIGTQYGTESERIIINEIINDRYEMDRPTILIGNVSFSEAEKILGARVIDRVKDNGEVMFFEWDSYRKTK